MLDYISILLNILQYSMRILNTIITNN